MEGDTQIAFGRVGGRDEERLERLQQVLVHVASQRPIILKYLICITDHEGDLSVDIHEKVSWDISLSAIEHMFRQAWGLLHENPDRVVIRYQKVSK